MVLEPQQPYSDLHRTSEEREICFNLRSEMECSGSRGREFWILLSIFVRSLATSTPPALHTIERCVLPLLDRLDFLWDCTDLRALRTLIYHLELAGLQLPFHTRQALACELIRRALACESVSEARDCVDFAKIIVNHYFHAVVGAIEEAALPFANAKQDGSDSDHMLAVVEEEVCWYICEDSRLCEIYASTLFNINQNWPWEIIMVSLGR
ncbi:hypothetical protein O6H91_11G092800 [Diphasiastrum complanatum]|uniref:Uncharacterized protein n=1 Tax=Diphasiastrum complanatum TaxID=34168 RepID=A0ACC2CC38_DIPCM|nr:hypothetical protein O6H91_Y438500 [Diphasiastrum complanatum]KAJ7539439.1 hypothetical protein O6H91_11G092800 [Diphasiastrum complanatum]